MEVSMNNDFIQKRAEEQVLLLLSICHMSPGEIIESYTGKAINNASFTDAVKTVEKFNRYSA